MTVAKTASTQWGKRMHERRKAEWVDEWKELGREGTGLRVDTSDSLGQHYAGPLPDTL